MKRRFVEINLGCFAPKGIGCGLRVVELEVGRKWAYVTVPSTGIKRRIAASIIALVKPRDVKVRRKYRKPYSEVRS